MQRLVRLFLTILFPGLLSSHGLAQVRAPQGSFPRLCSLINELRDDFTLLGTYHQGYRQFYQRSSPLYEHIDSFYNKILQGSGKDTMAQIRDQVAVYTVIGSESYRDRARACSKASKPLSAGTLSRMDRVLADLTLKENAFLFEDVFNIRVSVLNAEYLEKRVQELVARTQTLQDKIFLAEDSGRSVFEPCHTFEAAMDIFFEPLVPDLVQRWNRYKNPKAYEPFWGGRETLEKSDSSEIAKLRYDIYLAAGASWTIEQAIFRQGELLRRLAATLEKYAWEVKVFKSKSRYDAFFCRMEGRSNPYQR